MTDRSVRELVLLGGFVINRSRTECADRNKKALSSKRGAKFKAIFLLLPALLGFATSLGATADDFRFPLDNSGWYLSQDFCVWNSGWGGNHLGEDYVVNDGTELPVYAPANGIVRHNASRSGYGRVVIIEHQLPDGSYVSTVHGHMRSLGIVGVGTAVSKGQLIGYLSADSTENGGYDFTHLHFGVRQGAYSASWIYYGYGSNCNGWFDPADFVNSHKGSGPSDKSLITPDGQTIYWLRTGRVYHVANPAVLNTMSACGMPGWSWSSITSVATLSPYTVGPEFVTSDSGSNGLLIKLSGESNPTVYLVQNGRRRPFTSEQALNWGGTDWFPHVIEVCAEIFSAYLPWDGPPIYSVGDGGPGAYVTSYNTNATEWPKPDSWKGWPGPAFSSALWFPCTAVESGRTSGYSGIVGTYQGFEDEVADDWNSSISSSVRGTYAVYGEIHRRWRQLSYEASQLGYPTSTEYAWSGQRRNDFEGGYILWNPISQQTQVVYCTPPSITDQPQSQTITSGQSAQLSVAASGTSLSYQWYRGSSGDTSQPISGATSNTYSTGALTLNTTYWVRVSNNCDSVNSNTATVIISRVLSLFGGRFTLQLDWRSPEGHTGSGMPVAVSPNSGYFWFFGPENVELFVKILDGRGVNGCFWVFYGALTNIEYTMTVRDTQTGSVKTYFNPQGTQAGLSDVTAFSGSLGSSSSVGE
ncbi:MAG: hypothetical protein EHM61_27975, partial [Acidobacteria bacterium]